MKRLTTRTSMDGKAKLIVADGTLSDKLIEQIAIQRLAEYEDAEEQELLMNLPCKMTDEVYTLHDGKVCTRRILVMGFDWAEGFCILTEDGYRYPKRLFNKILFFSHEAAEKALEDA